MSLLLSGATITGVASVEGCDEVTFNPTTGLINVYKIDASKTINPANDPLPARITSLTGSGNTVNITYNKVVTQTLIAGYTIPGKTALSISGSGTSWSVTFNSAVSGSELTYKSNNGNAVTPGSGNKKVCDYIDYPIS